MEMKFSIYSFLFACIYLFLNDGAVEAKLQCKYKQIYRPSNYFLRLSILISCDRDSLWLGKVPPVDIPNDWITMVDPCTKKMKNQIQEELTAAMTYLAMVSCVRRFFFTKCEVTFGRQDVEIEQVLKKATSVSCCFADFFGVTRILWKR
jgi:hypothetical protein